MFLDCDNSAFLAIGNRLFSLADRRMLSISNAFFESILDRLETMYLLYELEQSETLLMFVIGLLEGTMHLWLGPSTSVLQSIQHGARDLSHSLAAAIQEEFTGQQYGLETSWQFRDAVVRYFRKYLCSDPAERFWTESKTNLDLENPATDVEKPSDILVLLTADRDIRVRFRVAVDNAHLLNNQQNSRISSDLYIRIFKRLTNDLTE